MITDEQPIQEIIRRLREERGLSQSKLAKLSGIDRGYINQLEHGKAHSITLRTARALAKGLGVSADVFLQPATIPKETPEDILNRLKLATPVSVPVYAEFHAGGIGMEPVDYVYLEPAKRASKNIEAYIVHGRCLDPPIRDGDIIVIDRDREIEHGDIVACLFEGSIHLGRLKKIAGELWLENSERQIKFEECETAAKVIERISKF